MKIPLDCDKRYEEFHRARIKIAEGFHQMIKVFEEFNQGRIKVGEDFHQAVWKVI